MTKQYFTARYDPRTDKIEGCSYGSKEWHHENRHKQQFKSNKIQDLEFLTNLLDIMAKVIALGAFVMSFVNYQITFIILCCSTSLFLPGMLFNFYLEYDAIKYARNKIKEIKSKQII